MNDELLSIGKMAALNHTSVPTLRLYDQEGLLHPAKTDPDSGYRYYTIRQSARFDMIQYMKELGMSLKEIRELLDKEDLDLIEEILIRKRRQTDDQIEKLRLQQMAIDRTVESIRRYRCSPSPGTIIPVRLPSNTSRTAEFTQFPAVRISMRRDYRATNAS